MVLLMHSGVFIGSCDVIGMEFPKGKWVCYSRILFYNHNSKQLTSAVVTRGTANPRRTAHARYH